MKIVQNHRLVLLPALLALLALVPLTACGGSDSTGPGGQRNAPSTILVLADSSLKSAFTQIGQQFESQNPGSTVTFPYGPRPSFEAGRRRRPGRRARDRRPAEHGRRAAGAARLTEVFATKGSNQCQIVTLTQSKNTALSTQFINLVLSQSGQQVLRKAGFGRREPGRIRADR